MKAMAVMSAVAIVQELGIEAAVLNMMMDHSESMSREKNLRHCSSPSKDRRRRMGLIVVVAVTAGSVV